MFAHRSRSLGYRPPICFRRAIQFESKPGEEITVDPSGIDHLAVKIEDVDATIETAVEEWNSEVTGEPKVLEDTSIRIAVITAPVGYVVELIEDV